MRHSLREYRTRWKVAQLARQAPHNTKSNMMSRTTTTLLPIHVCKIYLSGSAEFNAISSGSRYSGSTTITTTRSRTSTYLPAKLENVPHPGNAQHRDREGQPHSPGEDPVHLQEVDGQAQKAGNRGQRPLNHGGNCSQQSRTGTLRFQETHQQHPRSTRTGVASSPSQIRQEVHESNWGTQQKY